jgi:asparaginyl-tRNA synthetase
MASPMINDILAGRVDVGSTVTVEGWVRTRRDSKAGLSFVHVHDGSCFDPIQVVADSSLPNYQGEVLHLTTGCAVVATGKLVESQGKGQKYEIQAEAIEVVGRVEDPDTYPVSAKRHTFEYLRTVAHLRPRTNTFGAIARLRHQVSMSIHQFFHERGFYYVHTPIITASDCEGAGALFRVSTIDPDAPPKAEGKVDYTKDFFHKPAYLTVSGQLQGESFACALGKIYTFGPTFRAENSNTPRHLAEFWMIEPEMAFYELTDNMDLAEEFLKRIISDALKFCMEDLKFFAERMENNKGLFEKLENVLTNPFKRVSYTEGVEILLKSGKTWEFPVSWGSDLQSEHERYLAEQHFKCPVILYDYPRTLKPFYMKVNDDGKTVRAMDVLVPGVGEIIGGSQREERLDVLESRMKEQGLHPEGYSWYCDLRRYGTVPHSGFGLGLERTILFLSGMSNIRDVIPFPRTPGNAEF